MRKPNGTTAIIQEAFRRFPNFPSRTIARYILQNNGDSFDNDYEKIRSRIRYYKGANGEENRRKRGLDKPMPSVSLPATWRKTRKPHKLEPGLWLVINDLHIPFHEPKPIESTFAYAKQQGITGIFINGDAQDCAAVSFWPSGRKRDFDKEVELFIDFLDFLEQEFPGIPVVYKPGNHEYRLPRMYQAKMPDLIGLPLLAMDSVLGLEQRGIEFLDYHQLVYAGKLPILHGHEISRGVSPVNPARGLFLKTKMWAMCGHHHRTSEHTETNLQGTMLTTWSTGCLCDLSPDYLAYGSNWNWGFALVNVEKNGDFEVQNRRLLLNSKVV